MTFRNILPFIALLLSTLVLVAAKRPNILFFFSDDHSLQTLGVHNGRMKEFIRKHELTPNIDKLASEGMYFENSFVCNSICGPSRAAILTGKHSEKNGFKKNGDKFDVNQWTLVSALNDNGYDTAIFGKLHLSAVPDGFDESWVIPGQGFYYNPDFFVGGYGGKKTRVQGYISDIIGDMTIDWLKERKDDDKPFFLCSWHKAPHRNWLPPKRYLNYLHDVDVPEPDNLFDDYQNRSSVLAKNTMTVEHELNIASDLKVTAPAVGATLKSLQEAAPITKSFDRSTFHEIARMSKEQREAWDEYYVPRNEAFRAANLKGKDLVRWKYQQYLKDYMRSIKALDDNVGRVIDYLKEAGLADNTIIIYSSDQGFYNGEHGWYDKRWMYEESMRNPFIIKWPGVTKAGSRVTPMIQNIDYAPTLLDAVGIDIPDHVHGESFKRILEGKDATDWRKQMLYTYYEHGGHGVARHYGVRGERYKLIRFPTTNEWEFYDLEEDPSEMYSMYGAPKYYDEILSMKSDLNGLLKKYDVSFNEDLSKDFSF